MLRHVRRGNPNLSLKVRYAVFAPRQQIEHPKPGRIGKGLANPNLHLVDLVVGVAVCGSCHCWTQLHFNTCRSSIALSFTETTDLAGVNEDVSEQESAANDQHGGASSQPP